MLSLREVTEREEARAHEHVRRWLLVLVVIGAALGLYLSGAFDDPAQTVELIRAAGGWGALAYLAAFAILQPLGISGHVFVLAAAAIWAPWVAFTLALAGAVGAACVSFAFARYVAYDWVQARAPARVRKVAAWVERGFSGIVAYRLLTFTMHPAQLLMGTLRVRLAPMLLGTAIGFAPAVAIDVFLGGRLWDWLTR